MSVRVMVAGSDPAFRSELKDMMLRGGYEIAGMARDSQEAIQLVMQFEPHVALVSQDLSGVPGLATCEMMTALASDVMPILMVSSKSPEMLDSALMSGARAVMQWPASATQLVQRIEDLVDVRSRRASPEFAEWKDPTRYPRIISVTGARGGVGKSTIAANLSIILARQRQGDVLLLDLYTQFGDIPSMFNITPKGAIVDIMPSGEDMDVDLVENSVTKHPSGVHILVISVDPLPLDAVTDEFMDGLFYVLKRKYRYIVVDVPPMLHHTTLNALAHSNLVLLVANLFDLTTVADTRKFFDAIRVEQIGEDKVGIVLNRVSKENKLHAEDVERLFECCVLARVPHDVRLMDSVNQGVPLALSDDDSLFIRSMTSLSRKAMGLPDLEISVTRPLVRRNPFVWRKQAA